MIIITLKQVGFSIVLEWVEHSASDYSNDLNFTIREAIFNSRCTDTDGDGNNDNGYTKLSTSSYKSSIFGSSNVNTTAAISLSAVPFVERDYGAIVATINYSGGVGGDTLL